MSGNELNITVETLKRVELVTVKGRVDSSNASELDNTLKDIMSQGRHNIVLNLKGVNYMSSAGLRAIVSALRECKSHRGDVRLSEMSERVAEVLDLAGLTSSQSPLFQTYSDDTAAVGSF